MRSNLAFAAVCACMAADHASATSPPLGCGSPIIRSFSTDGPREFPFDIGTFTTFINVSGAESRIWDVDLHMSLRHTWTGDLEITLISPSGTTATLVAFRDSSTDDVFRGTLWDDQALLQNVPGGTDPVPSGGYFNLVTRPLLVPEEAMGVFIGENPNGAWAVSVHDDQEDDSGSLDSATLVFALTSFTPPIATSGTAERIENAAINDFVPVVSSITLSNLPGLLTNIRVTTHITHTACGDLNIQLISPRGIIVPLSVNNGGVLDNVFNGTVWRDDAGKFNAPGPVTSNALVNNVLETPLCPQGALSAVLGESPNGEWMLTILDDVGFDVGALVRWSLFVETCGDPACPADLNGDGIVNSSDLARVLATWGVCP